MLSTGVTPEDFLEEEALLHTQLPQTLPVLPLLFFLIVSFMKIKKRGSSGGSDGKASACNAGRARFDP